MPTVKITHQSFVLTRILILMISLLSVFISLAQPQGNRMAYKYKIGQKTIDAYDHVVSRRLTPNNSTLGDPVYLVPGDRQRPASISYDKGNILVDFWSIIDYLDTSYGPLHIHHNAPAGTYEIKDNNSRTTLADRTQAIKIKFDGLAIGVSSIPFRYRFKAKIDNSNKTQPTVTSPRPDIAFNFGMLWGHSTFSRRGVTHWPKTVSLFVGATAAEIKNGVVKSTSSLYNTTKSQINPAATYGLQFALGRNNFGILEALGFESSFGKFSGDWIYQTAPYLGIGLVANAGIF